MAIETEPCSFLNWDSEFFGRRIGRLCGGPELLPYAEAWCRENRIDCLYYLSDRILSEAVGLDLVDVRLTLETAVPSRGREGAVGPAGLLVRPHHPSDLPRLREIARVSHHDSRFYSDPHFPRAACDRLYEAWIERSCRGWADRVFVAEAEGTAAGYLTCHLADSRTGSIGLVAVAPEQRGRGVGRRLIAAALDYFAGSPMERVSVVTQERNAAARRLYEQCGFSTTAMQFWYHYWPPGKLSE